MDAGDKKILRMYKKKIIEQRHEIEKLKEKIQELSKSI